MISKSQQKWLDHLSTEKKIKIYPYDLKCNEIFLKIKKKIQNNLGKGIKVEHRGASSLGISGQDEIDVYLPVSPAKFNLYVSKMTEVFGKPRSLYPLERVRFSEKIDKKKIDLFLINEKHQGWIRGVKFEKFLKKNTKFLKKYEKLKENAHDLSVKGYYTRKNKFINEILDMCG